MVLARLQPATFETLNRAPGSSVVIRAMHVNCGAPNGVVDVSVSSGEVITLRDNGIAPDDVAGDGEYSGRWTASTPGTFDFSFPQPETDTFRVFVDEMLEAGFPVRKNTFTDFDDPPGAHVGVLAVGNVDADPQLEIVADTLQYGPIHVLNHDGSDVPGWPVYQGRFSRGVSLGEIDGDPTGLEIVANHYYFGTHIYDGRGLLLPGWPPQGGYGIDLPAPIIDVDGDGRDEVVLYPLRRADGSEWRTDVQVPAIPLPQEGPVGMVVVGDLDADGSPEFVTPGGGGYLTSIYVSDRDGLRPGFPIPIPRDALAEGWPHLLIGDVDGDGAPNIIVPSWRRELSGQVRFQVMVFSNRGKFIRAIVTDSGSLYTSLADLDGDGFPEIIRASENHLHAWRGDGTELPGWPASIVGGDFAGTTHPVVGDVDGDGRPDVVVGARFAGGKALHAIRYDGTSVAGFPKNFWGEGGGLNTPAIADIDLDGRNEIIVNVTSGNGLRDAVFVYDTHGAAPYGPLEWPQYMGSAQRRGYYETGKNLPNHAYVATQVYGAGSVTADGGGINCGADCIERYAKGTSVVLRAPARAGGTFARWHGACAGQGNPCTLQVQRFAETSADFDSRMEVSVTGDGSVSSSLPGITCPGDCSEAFPARSMVTLTATETAGSDFTGWSGACSGTQGTCQVFIDDAKDVGASFVNDYPLTVNKSGGGTGVVTSSVPGIDCGADCTNDFPVRSTVRITIVPNADTRLVSWHRLGCLDYQLTCDVVMNGPVALNIELALKPVMTVTVVGDGRLVVQPGGECASTCRIPVDIGLVMLTAIPEPGGEFLGFAGLCAGQGNLPNCNHYMNSDILVKAVFGAIPRLTLDFQGAGSGTVRGPAAQECTTDCEFKIATPQVISLTATVGNNSVFGGWSGACTGTAATCEVPFTANTTVGVTFNVAPPPPPPPPPPPTPPPGSGKGGGGALSLLELAALALLLAWSLSRRACPANPAASRTRSVPSRPCGNNPRDGCRTSRVDRSRARC